MSLLLLLPANPGTQGLELLLTSIIYQVPLLGFLPAVGFELLNLRLLGRRLIH